MHLAKYSRKGGLYSKKKKNKKKKMKKNDNNYDRLTRRDLLNVHKLDYDISTLGWCQCTIRFTHSSIQL